MEEDEEQEWAAASLDYLYRVSVAIHAMHADADERAVLQAACSALVDGEVFRGAWIGVPRPDHGLDCLTTAGEQVSAYLDHVRIRVDDSAEGRGPVGRAWRSGEPVVVSNWARDAQMAPWRAAAARFGGWNAAAAFPLRREGRPWAVWTVYTGSAGVFDEHTALLGRLTADMLGRELDWREASRRARGRQALYQALAAVGEVTRAVALARGEQRLLQTACAALADSPLFQAAWVQRPNADGWFEILAAAGLDESLLAPMHCHVERDRELIVSRAWRGEALLQVTAADAETGSAERMRRLDWGGIVVAPVRRSGTMWALLCAVTAPQGALHAESVDLLRRLSEQIGHGLDHRDHLDALAESRAFYAALAQANDAVRQQVERRDDADLLNAFCRALARGELFTCVAIGVPGADGALDLRGASGAGAEFLRARKWRLDEPAAQTLAAAWNGGRLACCADVASEPALAAYREELLNAGWGAYAAVPVYRGATPWGLLIAAFTGSGELRADAAQLFARLAALLGDGLTEIDERRALEKGRVRDQWLATHDGLTGIGNRSVADTVLPRAIARAHRLRGIIAVAYLDLDGFKEVNDNHGHRLGDELLKHVAQRGLASLRETDILVRWGGDEFLCILEGLHDAADIAPPLERLLAAIAQPVLLEGREFNIRSSCGVALYPEDAEQSDALIRCADLALYAHKTHKADPGRPLFARYGSDVSEDV